VNLSVFFCTSKIQGGQDRAFLFQCGLANYKAHYNLSLFRPLFGGNSPTSSGLILKMNSGYNGGELRAREACEVKGELFLCLLPKG
jgi:hypothetical protein